MPSHPELGDKKAKTTFGFTVFLRWFLIPALAVAIGVGLVSFIAILTTTASDPEELLYQLRPGNSEMQRWQAAYGLAMAVRSRRDELSPHVKRQVIRYFAESLEEDAESDPRFRRFLALTLLALRDPESVSVLRKALDIEDDVTTRIYALKALAEIGPTDDDLSVSILRMLGDSDPAIRKTAAYAAGRIGTPVTIGPLRESLGDPEVDVRWNAALALARMGDKSGLSLLARMLDHSYVRSATNLSMDGESEVVKSAIVAVAELEAVEQAPLLRRLQNEHPDPEVRRLAARALETFQGITPP